MYVAAGGSDDYAIDVARIPYSYTFELGHESLYFAVPPEHLKLTLNEGWTAIRAMIMHAITM